LIRKPKGKKPFGRPRIDGKIILKWSLKKYDVRVWNVVVNTVVNVYCLLHFDAVFGL
jgi:hypothetical protein